MRSVIDEDNTLGIDKIKSNQQFEIGESNFRSWINTIIEPEVTINIDKKSEAEDYLHKSLTRNLNDLNSKQKVLLKLTLPEKPLLI